MSDWTRKPFFINSTSSTFLDWCWHYAQGGGHRAGEGRAILTLKIPAPSGSPKPPLAEWRFTVETETPVYFWNLVISHIVRHNRRLETQEHGPLLLDVGDGPEHPHPDPETAIIEAHHALLAVVLNSIDPDRIPSEAEIRAFFDPDNPERPRTLHLPKRVHVFLCSILALGDRRLSVHLQTWLPEAIPYITAMLPELGYPEIARQIETPLQQPPEPEPAQVGAQSQGAEARSDSRAGGRPPKTELTPEEEKATREYLARIGKGTPKKAAAELGGHAYETFERWAKLLGE